MQNPILLFVLTIISTPVILATVVVGFICRQLRNIILGPYLRLKYGEGVRFLAPNDAMLAVEGRNNSIYAGLCFLIKGKANISAYQNLIHTKWVKSTLLDDMYKLSCRLCCEFGYYFWVPEKDFKIEQHCYLRDFVPKNEHELYTYYSEIISRRFSDDLSPWSFTCINLDENFPGLDGPHHIYFPFSQHALTDGVSYWLICNTYLFDQTNEYKIMSKLNPSNVPIMTKLKRIANLLVFGPGAAVLNLLNFPDKSILHGQPLIGTRLFAFSKTISLDRIKRVKNLMNTTVNDVMTSSVAGGLRSYLLRKGVSPKSNKYIIAVGLQELNKPPRFENRLAPVIFHDAADQSTPTERLLSTRKNMNEIKSTESAVVSNFICNAFCNSLPRYVSKKVSSLFSCTVVSSNLPCPNKPCYIFGQKVIRIGGITPGLSQIGIGISATTYNGEAQYGINADIAIIKTRENLYRLLDDIVREFEELEKSI